MATACSRPRRRARRSSRAKAECRYRGAAGAARSRPHAATDRRRGARGLLHGRDRSHDGGGLRASRLARHAADLAQCRAEVREPLRGSYRGLTISTDPPPAIGALLLELLNILEGYDVRALGQESAAYYDLLARALCWSSRTGDASPSQAPAPRCSPSSLPRRTPRSCAARSATSSLDGAAAVGSCRHDARDDLRRRRLRCQHDAHGLLRLRRGDAGLGFMHNNGMCMFDPRPGQPNSIAPGKRPSPAAVPPSCSTATQCDSRWARRTAGARRARWPTCS